MAPIPQTSGRYTILNVVGRGGMGVLYRARDPILERDVALKMMLVDFTVDPTARDRFQREAKAIARLQHRNIVTIHELGEADGTPYIVMEFLGGKDLESLLGGERPMTLAEKLDVGIQLCEGLAYAHEQGIVHRDIKPGNVRVLEDGTVKILDFGIARFAQSSVTQSGEILGTASYMAPEQIMGKAVDARADVFSVGVLLHEILTGSKPFSADTPTATIYQIMHVEPAPIRSVTPELPEALDEIVSRALQKNPDERYGSASELAADLQMVKMMLDLPLQQADGTQATGTQHITGKLHATMIGARSSVLAPAPPTAAAAAPAPVPVPVKTSRAPLFGAIAAGVLVVGAAGAWYVSTQNKESSAPAAAAAAAAPVAGAAAASPVASTAATAGPMIVSSVPPGAKITLNGTDTGKVTPAALTLDGSGPSAITLALKGYQPIAATLTDSDLKAGNKEFRLAREAGPVQLVVSAAFPFELVQGAKVLSASARRHELTVQPGGGPVKARNAEYLLDSNVPIDFQRSQADVTLPALGTLAVFSVVETCSVLVDGHDLGFPPIPRKPIASGSHTVAIKCQDGKEDSQKVILAAGESGAVRFGTPKS